MHGTKAAPNASGTVVVGESSTAAETGLSSSSCETSPQLPKRAYYEMFLTRNGKPVASCGTFAIGQEDRDGTAERALRSSAATTAGWSPGTSASSNAQPVVLKWFRTGSV